MFRRRRCRAQVSRGCGDSTRSLIAIQQQGRAAVSNGRSPFLFLLEARSSSRIGSKLGKGTISRLIKLTSFPGPRPGSIFPFASPPWPGSGRLLWWSGGTFRPQSSTMSEYLLQPNANCTGRFPPASKSRALISHTSSGLSDFLNASPGRIVLETSDGLRLDLHSVT